MKFFMEMFGDVIVEVIIFAGMAAILIGIVMPFALDIIGRWCL